MPRAKVDASARKRVARACQACRSRKQKCDGQSPCLQCSRHGRAAQCTYPRQQTQTPDPSVRNDDNELPSPITVDITPQTGPPQPNSAVTIQPSLRTHESDETHDVDAPVPRSIRMLRDSRGKLMYIGDSAALSFLQTIRQVIGKHAGPNNFSFDPLRHFMLEHTVVTTPRSLQLHDYPDLDYARSATLAYFASTSGILDIFDNAQFIEDLNDWINGQFANDEPTSAVFFLVLAIGAQSRLTHPLDETRAQVYFDHGRQLACPGLMDDPSMAATQAFILITYYMLAACRRNGAYLNLGIAARSGFAMGLHKQAANSNFEDSDGISRRQIWKSLRMLDLIISSTLGRPAATTEFVSDFVCEQYTKSNMNQPPNILSLALNESLRVFLIVEKIVADVYTKKTISVAEAETIAAQLRKWSAELPQELRETTSSNNIADIESQGAVLAKANVAFSYYNAMMLLMRPFLIFYLKLRVRIISGTSTGVDTSSSQYLETEKAANACIDSAVYMLDLMWSLLEKDMLFKNMTILIAWVFAAGLVVGFAFFSTVGNVDEIERALKQAIAVCNFYGASSAQGQRYHHILTELHNACTHYHFELKKKAPSARKRNVSKIFELSVREERSPASIAISPSAMGTDILATTEFFGPAHGEEMLFTVSGDLVTADTSANPASAWFPQPDDIFSYDNFGALFGVHGGTEEQYMSKSI